MIRAIAPSRQSVVVANALAHPVHVGDPAELIRQHWKDTDGFIVFLPPAAVVSIIGPLLNETLHTPAVICVDEASSHVVALAGSRTQTTDDLARSVAWALDATSMAPTRRNDLPNVFNLAREATKYGLRSEGDVLGVNEAVNEGRCPVVVNPFDWPLPPTLRVSGDGPERVGITDELIAIHAGIALLRPPTLIVGVNLAKDTPETALEDLLVETLAQAELSRSSVVTVVTKPDAERHRVVERLNLPVRSTQIGSPNQQRSEINRNDTTYSVCESLALQLAGPQGRVIVSEKCGERCALAVVRRRRTSMRMASATNAHAFALS